MRTAGLRGISRAKGPRTTIPGTGPDTRPDLVDRKFTADGPNQLWVIHQTQGDSHVGPGQVMQPGPLGQGHDRDQARARHEVRVIETRGDCVANSHLPDVLLLGALESSRNPIVPGQEDIRASRPAQETTLTGGSRLSPGSFVAPDPEGLDLPHPAPHHPRRVTPPPPGFRWAAMTLSRVNEVVCSIRSRHVNRREHRGDAR